MGNFERLAESAGVNLNRFENTIITLKGSEHIKLEKRLEVIGYRKHGPNKCDFDKYLCTFSNGTYEYFWNSFPEGHKPVNYKDIMGEQITTVDFVKGIMIGLCVGIFISFIIGLLF